jgi:hypothetical protein
MIPPNLVNFFIASASAGGALLGLLFVAVSIAPERIVARSAPVERQAVAASTYTALFNAFFVSLGALIPGATGSIAVVMSSLGLLNSLLLAFRLFRHPQSWQNFLRRVVLIIASLVIYGSEFSDALGLTITPSAVGNAYALAVLLLTVYGLGLPRAWELLGVTRFGLLARLNPLYDVNESVPIPDQHLSDSAPEPADVKKFPESVRPYSNPKEHNEP